MWTGAKLARFTSIFCLQELDQHIHPSMARLVWPNPSIWRCGSKGSCISPTPPC